MSAKTIEDARESWARTAKEHGWYTEPFYVQIWQNEEGEITDSVSFGGMTQDIIVQEVRFICDTCEQLHYEDDSCIWDWEE